MHILSQVLCVGVCTAKPICKRRPLSQKLYHSNLNSLSASARDLCRRSQLQLLQDAAAIVGQVKAHVHGSRGSSRSHGLNYYFTNGAAVPHPFSKAYAHQWSMAHFGAPPSAVAGTFREAMLSSHSMLVIGIFVVI